MDLNNIFYLFSLAALDVFKGEDIPDFIKTHPLIENIKKLKKVFPSFGLKNFKEKVDIKSDFNKDAYDAAVLLIKEMSFIIAYSLNKVDYKTESNVDLYKKNKLIYSALAKFNSALDRIYPLIKVEDKVKLILDKDIIIDDKTLFRSGESIFKIYNKLSEMIKVFGVDLKPIDSLKEFKLFSKENVPKKTNWYVVFSSEGEKGAWDISTMSERGISSCQSWGGQYKECLVGSIVSKYVGIIYLTSGSETERGEKMNFRSVVRFGIDTTTSKPVIIVDKMYPEYLNKISEIFVDSLQKRTSLKVLDYTKGTKSSENVPEPFYVRIPYEKGFGALEEHELSAPYKDIKFPTHKKEIKKEKPKNISTDEFYRILDSIRRYSSLGAKEVPHRLNMQSEIFNLLIEELIKFTNKLNPTTMLKLIKLKLNNLKKEDFKNKIKNNIGYNIPINEFDYSYNEITNDIQNYINSEAFDLNLKTFYKNLF